jgi:hypothetical protein
MHPEPQKEHQWLQKLVGEWTSDTEMLMGPDQPPLKCKGTDSVRSIGGLWVMCEMRGEMPGGGTATSFMTLGYDPAKKSFVGTFIASIMTHLWIYENGQLDASGKVLTLNAEGPSFSPECQDTGKMAKYQDIIEFKSDDHRVLSSQVLGEDGKWQHFMTAHIRRKK